MSDKKDDGGEGIAILVFVGFMLFIIHSIGEWFDNNWDEIVHVLTMIGIGLGGCLTLFGLWKLIRFIDRARRRREAENLELSQRQAKERHHAAQLRLARIQESYAAWLKSSPVDDASAQAEHEAKGLERQLKDLRELLAELQSRDTDTKLPNDRIDHEETLAAVQAGMKLVEPQARMWRERLIVLTAQGMLQRALRSVPPWLGGVPFEDRPHGSDVLWPKKPDSIPAALEETEEALKKVDAALVSMRKVEEQMAKELAGASREARTHLQTLLERAHGLRSRLSVHLAACQTREDRQRAFALIAKTPVGTLRAGELDAFFPKDIEPIDTELLMSVPQSFDLEGKLAELKAAVGHNVAAGSADHEVEATTQAPGGHALPPRRPTTTR